MNYLWVKIRKRNKNQELIPFLFNKAICFYSWSDKYITYTNVYLKSFYKVP